MRLHRCIVAVTGPYHFFCSDSGMVSAKPLTGAERHMVRVTYQRVRGFRPCLPYEPQASPEVLRLPPLEPPPGVHVSSSGGGSGSDDVNSRAQMTGRGLVPADVVAHYTRQLVAAGWTAADPAIATHVAAQYLEARDAAGAQWSGVLMATGDSTSLRITLNMRSRSPR